MALLVRSLWGLYRRHPWQSLLLITGIALGSALLTGVLILNQQTWQQQSQGDRLLDLRPIGFITARDHDLLAQQDFINLRNAGFHALAPVLGGSVLLDNGNTLLLMGIDPLSLLTAHRSAETDVPAIPNAALNVDFMTPPYRLWLSEARAKQLQARPGQQLLTVTQRSLPRIVVPANLPIGYRGWVDIGYAQELLNAPQRLSSIAVFDPNPQGLAALRAALPKHLMLTRVTSPLTTVALSDALHLNLLAMAWLAFVVGTFLAYSAVYLNLHHRQRWLGQLRLCGLSRRQLCVMLSVELLLLALLSTVLGAGLGYSLARVLLPGLATTLAEIYQQYISYQLPWRGLWLAYALASSLLALLLALASQLWPLLARAPLSLINAKAFRVHSHFPHYLSGLGLLSLFACAVLTFSDAKAAAYMQLFTLLLASALAMPALLQILLSLLRRCSGIQSIHGRWLLGNSRLLLRPAGIAMAALTLALVANLGMHFMIDSFRQATLDWINQRLVAQFFVHTEASRFATFQHWLTQHTEHATTALRWKTKVQQQGFPVEWTGLPSSKPYWQSIRLLATGQPPDAALKQDFIQGRGVLLSEQASRHLRRNVGDTIQLSDHRFTVLGRYHDYGNPLPQVMVDEHQFKALFPHVAPSGLAVSVPVDQVAELEAGLIRTFHLSHQQLIDQQQLRTEAVQIFDRTFAITHALNGLTLLIAALGIFCSASALEHQQTQDFALLRTLGWTRWQCLLLGTGRWLLLTLLALLLAWPIGLLLAAILVYRINPAAFGWSYPLLINDGGWWLLLLICLPTVALATFMPHWRLGHKSLIRILGNSS